MKIHYVSLFTHKGCVSLSPRRFNTRYMVHHVIHVCVEVVCMGLYVVIVVSFIIF